MLFPEGGLSAAICMVISFAWHMQNGIVKCHVTIGNMQATKQELARRQPFETAIKRPYFHIRPLDAAQLVTWNQYLDYVEQLGDPGATLRLYERCLVACASYAGVLMCLLLF